MAFIPQRRIVPPSTPTLPSSFLQKGFVPPDQARKRGGSKFRGLMIATEGSSDSGKTEFILSAPGPGMIVACDRGFDAVFDNENPPPTRRNDFGIRPMKIPKYTDFTSPKDFLPYYAEFYRTVMECIANPDARTVAIDADNLSWDLQKLSEWGKLTTFPQVKFADPKAARMSFYHQLWESGKVIITSNMLQDEWVNIIDPQTGAFVLDDNKEPKRERSGNKVAKGFPDQEYLWALRLRNLYKPAVVKKIGERTIRIPQQWGVRITKCKAKPELIGEELWGDSCHLQAVLALVYPHIDPAEWGY